MSRLNRSLVRALDRYEKEHAPKPRVLFVWLAANRPSFTEQRDALIAEGHARATDRFIPVHWRDFDPAKAS
jgi:hypothetical protein